MAQSTKSKRVLPAVEADNPLSISDGAPRTIELIPGVNARMPSAMDYRVLAALDAHVGGKGLDDWDTMVSLLYCILHTTRAELSKLWHAAREPGKLSETIALWQAKLSPAVLTQATDAIRKMDESLQAEIELDDDARNLPSNDGKKKTGSP